MNIHHHCYVEPWRAKPVDNDKSIMTEGRLKHYQKHLKREQYFYFTCCDGTGNIDTEELTILHNKKSVKVSLLYDRFDIRKSVQPNQVIAATQSEVASR